MYTHIYITYTSGDHEDTLEDVQGAADDALHVHAWPERQSNNKNNNNNNNNKNNHNNCNNNNNNTSIKNVSMDISNNKYYDYYDKCYTRQGRSGGAHAEARLR